MNGPAVTNVQKNAQIQPIKLTSGNPYDQQGVQEPKLNDSASLEHRKFEVCCNAGEPGHLEVATDAVSVRIGQRIRKNGHEEVWDSLLVQCKEQDDGSLAVEVVVYHPDWDEPLRIASIQSNPSNGNGKAAALRCDFQQKQL
jgi:hypothetical protein